MDSPRLPRMVQAHIRIAELRGRHRALAGGSESLGCKQSFDNQVTTVHIPVPESLNQTFHMN